MRRFGRCLLRKSPWEDRGVAPLAWLKELSSQFCVTPSRADGCALAHMCTGMSVLRCQMWDFRALVQDPWDLSLCPV